MSKYIRTKDGRIFSEEDYENAKYYCLTRTDLYNLEEVKRADTIDKLCDAFVMFCPNAICRKIRVYETMRSISLYSKRDERWKGNMVDKVYGAIWTDKGLVYVAKMNDKGELELL